MEGIEIKQISWYDDRFYRMDYLDEHGVEIRDYFPSVTTKLSALAKPFLLQWYGDIGTREAKAKMNEAGEKGTRVHYAWNTYINGGAVVYNPRKYALHTPEELKEVTEYYNGNVYFLENQEEMYDMHKLQRFNEIVKPDHRDSEMIVYDIENRDAGTLDNLMYIDEGDYEINGKKPIHIDEGLYIGDLKTGGDASVGKSACMQIACYTYCVEAMGLGEVKGGLILHTGSKNRSGIEGFGVTLLDRARLDEEYQDYRDISRVWQRNFGTLKPKILQVPNIITIGE